jgi:malate dehydrogenase (oxaloacetate-decarboxylating)(NADP+)
MSTETSAAFRAAALDYHAHPTAGKLAVTATKPLLGQRDLALAYSPGVAAPSEEIVADPANAYRYTGRGNLVAVISNGTAVLGLGNIGALASKPVMEGKAVLFKKFAGVDVFDIEIDEQDPKKLVDVIATLEPTFGAINLEDIKAPDCFHVERELRRRLKIPVFHDDQHGTAIVVAAAMLNALEVTGKEIGSIKLVASGAGAAALACLKLLVKLGLPRRNIWVTDLAGVVYEGRTELMDDDKRGFAQPTEARSLSDVVAGADVFLGLSARGVLKPDMVGEMAPRPIIFALANPTPEISPEEVRAIRDDAVIATGRADYPNQVNNVLCFPYIFRGALDCGATTITGMPATRPRTRARHRPGCIQPRTCRIHERMDEARLRVLRDRSALQADEAQLPECATCRAAWVLPCGACRTSGWQLSASSSDRRRGRRIRFRSGQYR